jgi:hypothetical protein
VVLTNAPVSLAKTTHLKKEKQNPEKCGNRLKQALKCKKKPRITKEKHRKTKNSHNTQKTPTCPSLVLVTVEGGDGSFDG